MSVRDIIVSIEDSCESITMIVNDYPGDRKIEISEREGNVITKEPDGLFVPAPQVNWEVSDW